MMAGMEPTRTTQDWALLATVLGHVAVVVLVAVGTLVMGERTPTGFLALATLSLGQLCSKCMAAVLKGRRTPPH